MILECNASWEETNTQARRLQLPERVRRRALKRNTRPEQALLGHALEATGWPYKVSLERRRRRRRRLCGSSLNLLGTGSQFPHGPPLKCPGPIDAQTRMKKISSRPVFLALQLEVMGGSFGLQSKS